MLPFVPSPRLSAWPKAAALTMSYNTRGKIVDYKELANLRLPRSRAEKDRCRESRLYPVEVIEKDSATGRVKIHYVGYSARCDEWRDDSDVVDTSGDIPRPLLSDSFSLYQELACKIKLALTSSRKTSPEAKIELPFDEAMFDILKEKGTLKKKHRGKEIYGITKYGDLDDLLGSKWFIRGLNENGDFCYAILNTVAFYLKGRINIVDFKPSERDGSLTKCLYSQGRSLVFTFVRADGVSANFVSVYSAQ